MPAAAADPDFDPSLACKFSPLAIKVCISVRMVALVVTNLYLLSKMWLITSSLFVDATGSFLR